MSRIIYAGFATGAVAGGQKMLVRHVETLCELGFNATYRRQQHQEAPAWLEHRAPVEVGQPVGPDDVLVLPEDAIGALKQIAARDRQVVVFCQNQFNFSVASLEALDTFPPERFPRFITPGPLSAASIKRVYPHADVAVVPCFADERLFQPGPKSDAIAYVPRKRLFEARMIRTLLPRYRADLADLPWIEVKDASEKDVAATFGSSSLFLSLSRFESVGMTPLEAMASGCVVAGFLGVGGREFATPENGFWVDDDDCEAAVDALAAAADLVRTGGPGLARYLESVAETARLWSFANFRASLEATWSVLAPGARL